MDSIRRVVLDLRERVERVFLYGQSMGGAIALYLASEGSADAVAVTGAALRLPLGVEVFAPLIGRIDIVLKKKDKKKGRGEFDNPGYAVHPSKAGFQLNELARATRERLHLVSCPVLICHSRADDTVPAKKVPRLIQERVAGRVTVEWFDESGHTMPLDVQGPEIAARIVEFFVAIEEDP
ncbi:MAG: alpha/beta hydrolase [Promethearchaeota archaeon]